MANELLTILEYIEQQRGISRNNLIKALETAITTASRKSIHQANELKVRIDPPTGKIQAWAILEVVDKAPNCDQLLLERARERMPDVKVGDVIEWEVTPSNFGRIAAQTARQTIMQQLRKAEKENVQEEFADRIGQIINGVVRRQDSNGILIDFQKAEGYMPAKEMIRSEHYDTGDHINALLLNVDIESAGPSLIVSRSAPEFVSRLFEREVSEIHDGVVKIMGVAREAGRRTKIAVASSDPRIDPVGACVGIRGARVRRITDELGSERVDIVPYDEDICKYAAKALLPAVVKGISMNESKHELTATVDEDQSRIAFGRKSQNVRLAAKLIGWNISIVNESGTSVTAAFEEQLRAAAAKLAEDAGISNDTAVLLVKNGFVTIEGIREADPAALLEIEGINADEINEALANLG